MEEIMGVSARIGADAYSMASGCGSAGDGAERHLDLGDGAGSIDLNRLPCSALTRFAAAVEP
jgi:hypothetical protein